MFNAAHKTVLDRRHFLTSAAAAASCAVAATAGIASANADEAAAPAPKYVFLFIGDGMGVAQVQIASYFLGTTANDGAVVSQPLSFMEFPYVGSVTTYDSTSFCPDSASTATSIATGNKTASGTINMDPETKTIPYETIAEKLHAQKGAKVGVISTVNINHATPAAFYAHQASRNSYYEISEELIASGFEYFAGGMFLAPTGKEDDKANILDVAAEAGYAVATTQAEAEAMTAENGKMILMSEALADGSAMNYSLDATEGEWQLSDYVRKGIEVLDGDEGFFMMAEAGKVDWACHANDAASSIHDVLELGNAVSVAVEFYQQHPQETLILVTADHETGGLSIGYATTNYDTYLTNLLSQTISYAKYDTDYVGAYIENGTSFDEAMADVEACFGLKASGDEDDTLVLTAYEYEQLQEAYARTMEVGKSKQAVMTQSDYEHYGTYQPFSMAICHILDAKSGIGHSTYAHTGSAVSMYALGCGADQFTGAYDNTQIYAKLAGLTEVE